DVPRSVSQPTLVEALWGEEPPLDPSNALQSLVSRLRRALGDADLLVQVPGGYRLSLERDDVDAHRFAEAAKSGRDALRGGRVDEAVGLLGDALAIWHGPTPEGWGDTTDSAAHQARLCEQRLDVTADLIEAEIALGRHSDVVAELESLTAQFPLRERFVGLLMRALAGAGRQAEALARYERVRRELADELGVDPSADLQTIQLAVLRGELGSGAASDDLTRSHEYVRRSNVKTALTSFVGRDDEVERIGKLLDEVRLVTLVGPGGAGKTRLATVAVTAILERVPDGVWLAELAPVTDPADVPSAVLDAFGLRDATLVDRNRPTGSVSRRDVTSRLIEVLSGRNTVLVLDNCEHVLDAAARLADDLLAQCPELRIVATSREPLGIVGESLVAVPPLPQPATGATPDQALAHPAVRLFADRAVAVAPTFVIDAATVAPVIEIVHRLDGLPLAIELAAARLRSLSVDEVATRLSDRFRLLTGGSRTAMPRHRTLRAVVEWSWDLLSAPERLLAERLAVFAGDISPVEAIAVCSDDDLPAAMVDELLMSLVDKSLLQVTTLDGGRRYRMLETIREFGLERMADRDEVATMRRRHANRFAALVHEAAPYVRGAEQLSWMARLETERENILAGLRFLCDASEAQAALDLALEMSTYWMLTGRSSDVASWTGFALEASGDADLISRLGAKALHTISMVTADHDRAPEEIEANFVALRELGRQLEEVTLPDDSLLILIRPVIAMFADDQESVGRLIEAGLKSSDPWIAASVRMFRAAMAENTGDVAAMRSDADIALAEFRAIGDRWGTASSLGVLAQLKTMESDLVGAVADLEEALALTEQLAGHDDALMLNMRLADLRIRTGDAAGARHAVEQMRAIADAAPSGHQALLVQVVMGEFARNDGDTATAHAISAKAVAQLSQLPAVHPARGHVAAIVLAFASKISLDDGDRETANQQLTDAYRHAAGTKDMPIVAIVGVARALYLIETDHFIDSAKALGAAARLRGSDDPTQPAIVSLTTTLRAELGDTAFDAAFASGRDLEVAAARALLDPSSG
ncbi:MAG TPA: BTAD domain-containing putative transcriptional regulator, partial [Acidothermaceae bacterium]|nr:BTAD domain-containing putative transcriptional regulator [Acidothermaceae bacterium]